MKYLARILTILALAVFGLYGKADAQANIPAITTIAALQALGAASHQYGLVYVQGYNTIGDWGGGVFRWNASSTASGDGCTVFTATGVGTGRWIRDLTGQTGLFVEQCGAYHDNTHFPQTTTAFQNAVNYVQASTTPTGNIYALGNIYSLNAGIVKATSFTCPNIIGAGIGATFIGLGGLSVETPIFDFVGGSGSDCQGGVRGATLVGDNNTIGIEADGQDGVMANIGWQSGKMPFLWCNCHASAFVEDSVLNVYEANVTSTTIPWGEFRVNNGGSPSFRNSGIGDETNTGMAGSAPAEFVLIDANALIYDGQLGGKITADDAGTGNWKLIQNNSGQNTSFSRGVLNMEQSTSNTLVVNTGTATYFAGVFEGSGSQFGANLKFGNFNFFKEYTIGASNVIQVRQATTIQKNGAFAGTSITLNPDYNTPAMEYTVQITDPSPGGAGYNWLGSIQVTDDLGSGTCNATVTSHVLAHDVGSWGLPTVGCTSNNPTISNANFSVATSINIDLSTTN